MRLLAVQNRRAGFAKSTRLCSVEQMGQPPTGSRALSTDDRCICVNASEDGSGMVTLRSTAIRDVSASADIILYCASTVVMPVCLRGYDSPIATVTRTAAVAIPRSHPTGVSCRSRIASSYAARDVLKSCA